MSGRVPGQDQTPEAKRAGVYEHLFIKENIEAIKDRNHKVTKEKGHEGIILASESMTNTNGAIGKMKIAFEPMGQHKIRGIDKVPEWQAKRGKLIEEPELWPYKVLSFEVWAEATSYDPTAKNGGQKFQNMLQFLLVDSPGSGSPAFSGDVYYDAETSKRGFGRHGTKQNRPLHLKATHIHSI